MASGHFLKHVLWRAAHSCITLALSQFLALMITTTGVLSTMLANRGIHIPTTQAFVAYALLSLYLPLFLVYKM